MQQHTTEPLEIQRIRKCKALADTLLELRAKGEHEGEQYQDAWERLFDVMRTDERESLILDAMKRGAIPASVFLDYPGEEAFHRRIAEIMRLPYEAIRDTFAAIEAAPAALH